MRTRSTPRALLTLAAVVAVVAGACSGPVLANPPADRPIVTPAPSAEPQLPDPQPVELPRDDGPHDRLTEWWYYTGHLRADDGTRLGFEYVVFRAERGGFPVSWASHLALTDETGDAFHYAQRAEIGPQADGSPRDASGTPTGFALAVTGLDVTGSTPAGSTPWTMSGSLGEDRLAAAATPAEVQGDRVDGFGLDLALTPRKAPALHDEDGYVDFGVAGGSYYYSRTSMTAGGTVTLGDRTLAVEGDAWFDHQWGDFISVGGGGWDWFAVNLEDGTELTVSLVRAGDGTYPLVYGTLVAPEHGRIKAPVVAVAEDFLPFVIHLPPGSLRLPAVQVGEALRADLPGREAAHDFERALQAQFVEIGFGEALAGGSDTCLAELERLALPHVPSLEHVLGNDHPE